MAAERKQDYCELDLLDTAVIRFDTQGRIRFMNSAAEDRLLVSRDRAQGRYIGEVVEIPPELGDAIRELPDDSLGLRLHEMKLGKGLYDCYLKHTDDGDLLLEMHDLEWEQMRHRLQQREVQTAMLGLLSRNLGHEVRNPLGGIRGAAQLLADEVDSHDLATLARLIMREADRIDELILRFGQPELHRERLDLYPLLDEALELLRADFGGSVRIERDFDPSIPAISGDASALRRVILNLLRNACQAGASMLLIRTRVEHGSALLRSGHGSAIRLDVADDGQGVPESLRSLLFLPLVTSRRDGSGLGLALSQQIAAAHGGLLSFEPLSQGSQFSLFLPFASDEGPNGQDSGK